MRPHRWQPTRLLCPWDSPGKNTGVGCHFLLQCMKVKSESEVSQSCPSLSDPMDYSLPGSSAHGIFHAVGCHCLLHLHASILQISWSVCDFSHSSSVSCLVIHSALYAGSSYKPRIILLEFFPRKYISRLQGGKRSYFYFLNITNNAINICIQNFV